MTAGRSQTPSPTFRIVEGIGEVAPAAWDTCAGDADPFVSHAFLHALEASGSATAETGWAPRHLLAEDAEGGLLACAPLYLKSHSYGEYVFDWGWAEAWERAGRRYYPKLQCAVPFTPVGGRRLLVRPEAAGGGIEARMAQTMAALAERAGLSSAHVTFATEEEAGLLAAEGWLLRLGEQYHWQNRGYASFEDFLAQLSSRKRKAIRKEREQARALGLNLLTLSGEDIRAHHWDAFFRFYQDTGSRKWGQPYLTRDFFARLGDSLAERVVLMLATDGARPVAGALNLLGGDTLYGRYWGSDGAYRFLHFDLCYYRAIDFAIAHGVARVEAGAQGEHKISRGYLPVPTRSLHWIVDEGFRRAVARFLADERATIARDIAQSAEAGPYRRSDDD